MTPYHVTGPHWHRPRRYRGPARMPIGRAVRLTGSLIALIVLSVWIGWELRSTAL